MFTGRGDSGGPLFLKGENAGADVQVGVVSWGPGGCASGRPAVYSRISSVSDWIEREICTHSDFPPSTCPDQNEDTEDDPSVVPIEDNGSDLEGPTRGCYRCWWRYCWKVECTESN